MKNALTDEQECPSSIECAIHALRFMPRFMPDILSFALHHATHHSLSDATPPSKPTNHALKQVPFIPDMNGTQLRRSFLLSAAFLHRFLEP